MNYIDYFCFVQHVPCSIRSICFTCLTDIVAKWTKTLQNVFKEWTFFYIVAFLDYPIIYANGRLACLCWQVDEHVAKHVGCRCRAIRNLRIRFRMTGSTNDLPHRGRPRVISWTCICAIDSKLPLLLLLTHLGFIITESVRKLFVIVCGRTVYMTTSLRRMRFNAMSSLKSS